MAENIYGPGGLPIILSQYLKQTPDTNDTIDIATPIRRYRDVYAKRARVDSVETGDLLVSDEISGFKALRPSGQDIVLGQAASVPVGGTAQCVTVGDGANCDNVQNTVVGANAACFHTGGCSFGFQATCSGGGINAIAIGNAATAQSEGIAMGQGANATNNSTAIGTLTVTGQAKTIVIGGLAEAAGEGGTVIGYESKSLDKGANVFGAGTTNEQANSFKVGGLDNIVNIRANGDLTCDLGRNDARFVDAYIGGHLVGASTVRRVDDIVSSTGAVTSGHLCVFLDSTGKIIHDTGLTLSTYLPLSGVGPMTGNLDGGSKTFLMKGGEATVGSKFSQSGNGTVLSNSNVETSWFTGSTSTGSRTFAAPQTNGTSLEFRGLIFVSNMLMGSTLTFRVKNSSGTILSHVLTSAAGYVNKPIWFECDISKFATGGTGTATSRIIIDGEVCRLGASEQPWDGTIANTWDVTLQFSVASVGNALNTKTMTLKTINEF